MKPKIVAIVVAAVLLVGGAAFALTRFLAPSTDDALAFVPPDAYFYANFFIEPSNSQKGALDDFIRKLPGIESTEDVIQKLTEAVDESLEEEGLSYEDDVKPWLGDQFAVFAIPGGTSDEPNGAVLVESTDEGAARDFLDKVMEEEDDALRPKTYQGTDYEVEEAGPMALAFVEGFMVMGTEDAIKESIDTLAGEDTLETAPEFETATGPLRDDWIGLYYLDTQRLLDELQVAAGMTPEDLAAFQAFAGTDQPPQAGVLYVTSDSAVFEASGSLAAGPFAGIAEAAGEPGLVPELPAGSWAAFGIPQVGDTLTAFLDGFAGLPGFDAVQLEALFYAETGFRLEKDLLSWMGDAGFFVQGANVQDIGGGFVVESTDPAKTTAAVAKLEDLLVQQGLRPEPYSEGEVEGFILRFPGVPAPIYVLGGDRLAIAYGEAATEGLANGGNALMNTEEFTAAQEAVGDDFNISFYVDVDAAQAFGEAVASFGGAVDETYNDEVKPVLDVFTHVVGASKTVGDTLVSKFVVGVE